MSSGNAGRFRKLRRGFVANLFSIFACLGPAPDRGEGYVVPDTCKVLASSSVADLDRRGHEQQPQQQQQLVLPQMSQPSTVISQELLSRLHAELPTLARHRPWLLLYSTWRDGISLLTLYRKSSNATGHCLLAVRDTQGSVFGALVPAPLNPNITNKYQGDAMSFVFTTISGAPRVFHTTGANRFYVLCTSEALALGGGAHFALYLDNDLQNGSSGESQTFGNTCLANAGEFKLRDVEMNDEDVVHSHNSTSTRQGQDFLREFVDGFHFNHS